MHSMQPSKRSEDKAMDIGEIVKVVKIIPHLLPEEADDGVVPAEPSPKREPVPV